MKKFSGSQESSVWEKAGIANLYFKENFSTCSPVNIVLVIM